MEGQQGYLKRRCRLDCSLQVHHLLADPVTDFSRLSMYPQWGMHREKMQVKGKMVQFRRIKMHPGLTVVCGTAVCHWNCLLLRMVLFNWLLIRFFGHNF